MTSFVDQLREELVAAAAREQAHPRPRLTLPTLRPLVLATAGLALTAILVLAIAGALRSERDPDERPVKPPAPEGRPLFDGTLFPGERYRTRNFSPELSFVVSDDNWLAQDTETPHVLALSRVNRGGPGPAGPWPTLIFQRIPEVYDPGVRDRAAAEMPAPPNLQAWFARHPDLRVSRAEPVTVAGVSGVSFEMEVRFTRPAHSDPACRRDHQITCTFLAPAPSWVSLPDGWRLHMIQLRWKDDPFVIFTIATSERRLAALDRAAAQVLSSLRIDIP